MDSSGKKEVWSLLRLLGQLFLVIRHRLEYGFAYCRKLVAGLYEIVITGYNYSKLIILELLNSIFLIKFYGF